MKRVFITALLICLVASGGNFVSAKEVLNFRQQVQMPPEVESAATLDAVLPFLGSADMSTRIAAVRRIGQIGGSAAVNLLMEKFKNEPYIGAKELTPYLKLEIIEALQKIGTQEAKSSLLAILSDYRREGPRCPDKRYPYRDKDYVSVSVAILQALHQWKDSAEVLKISQEIALDQENVRDGRIREEAYKLYLKADMAKKGIATEQQAAEYLVNFMTERGISSAPEKTYVLKDDVGMMTKEAVEHNAATALLSSYGESALSYLEQELERVASDDKARSEVIAYAIGYLKER